MSRFEVEVVSSSHGLNQEELVDNFLSVIHSNQYILDTSCMYNSVQGTMGKPRNIRDNHNHYNLDSSL